MKQAKQVAQDHDSVKSPPTNEPAGYRLPFEQGDIICCIKVIIGLLVVTGFWLLDTCYWLRTIPNSQFLILNSQFLIPNSPILNS